MTVTIEVDKEMFENVLKNLEDERESIMTSMSYDERLRKDIINGRFFDGRVAVERNYLAMCERVAKSLVDCVVKG